jgi:hypothetical protein
LGNSEKSSLETTKELVTSPTENVTIITKERLSTHITTPKGLDFIYDIKDIERENSYIAGIKYEAGLNESIPQDFK